MLFRLSRASFWLAAALAAFTLTAAGGHATLLMALTLGACVVAFASWRAGISGLRQSPARWSVVVAPTLLDGRALRDAAAALAVEAKAADSFESALHAVARVLRSELGARQAGVFEVHGTDATHAMLSDVIESLPGFQAVPQRVRLDGRALGCAIRSRLEAGTPPDAVAVPVIASEKVVAVIELTGIDVPIEPQALADLLLLARVTLSGRARPVPHRPASGRESVNPEVPATPREQPLHRSASASGMLLALVPRPGRQSRLEPGASADTPRHHEPGFDDHVFKPLDPDPMRALLNQHARLCAPAEMPSSVGQGAAPVIDPSALARLAELDPTGENHLLERVLKAFQTSVSRLRPQADAARLSGDQAALRLVAHTLKSSSASIGAMHLSQLCAQIETAIRTARGDNLDAQLNAFDVALDSASDAIARLLEKRDSSMSSLDKGSS